MARATRIAFAGVGLIRARPRAVLAWGFVYLIFVYLIFGIVTSLLSRPAMERMLLAMPGPGSDPAAMPLASNMFVPILIVNLGMIGMWIVLLAAAMRAVLKPEEQGAFFIRVGLDELRLLGAMLLIGLIMFGIYLVSLLALGLFTALAAVAAAAVGSPPTGAAVVIVILLVVLDLAFLIAVQTRLALALPLTLIRGRIVVRGAWRRSKGHFWPLFGGFLLNMLVVAVAMAIFVLPVLLTMLSGDGIAGIADPRRQLALMQSPMLYPIWLLMPLLGGFIVAMAGGALGMAALETEPGAVV